MPIRWKLTLWYSSILAMILIVFGTSLYLFFNHLQTTEFDKNLKSTGEDVIRSIKVVDGFLFPLQQVVLPELDIFSTPEIFLQVINSEGRIVERSKNLGEQSLPLGKSSLQAIRNGKPYFETISVQGTKVRIFSVPILYHNRMIGVLQVGGSLFRIQESLENLRYILIIGVLFTILLAGSTGWFLAKRVLKPIDSVIRGTSAIQRGQDLKRRIEYEGPKDEIGQLIEQINQMFARLEKVYSDLEDSYQMQKRFVSDASHELRTPLTSMRGNIDFLLKTYKENPDEIPEVLKDISDEIERLTRLINDLLSLARADAGYQMNMEKIDLPTFLDELLPELEKLERKVPLKVSGQLQLRDLSLFGNRDFLKQLFFIIIENAFKYTQEGCVELQFERINTEKNVAKAIRIQVRDTGIGIDEQDLSHVFNRFFRGKNAVGFSGTGLGLPMAKWIVEQHRGEIHIRSKRGIGTTVEIQLPNITDHET